MASQADLNMNGLDFRVIDHGHDGESYFPGCGTWGTPFKGVATGIGNTLREALADALDGAEERRLPEVDALLKRLGVGKRAANRAHDNPDNPEWHRYVSVLW